MGAFEIEFPEGFDETEWLIESKGWFDGVVVRQAGRSYRITFYDAVRLAQDVADGLTRKSYFFERNLVVVEKVSVASIKAAIEDLVQREGLSVLAREPLQTTE